ncbi:hypothetical protein JCM8547_003572 [Rhodosporidiobolus lusitaniae]
MPVELLEWIFELAYDDDKPTGPLSRRLLPFDRTERFRRLLIESTHTLRRAYDLFAMSPHLGSLVETVDIVSSMQVDLIGGSEPMLTGAELSRLFSSFTNLRTMHIGDVRIVNNFVLSPRFIAAMPSSLWELHLVIPESLPDPFDPLHYSVFSSLSSLTHLSLDARWCGITRPNSPNRIPTRLPHITSLHLDVHVDETTAPALAAFSHACHSLTNLILEHSSIEETPDYTSLVPLLPTNLSSLSLLSEHWSVVELYPCDAFFPRFTQIEELYLTEGTFDHSTLRSNLSSFTHLTSLGFDRTVEPTVEFLLSLVHGRDRLRSLETLTLDFFSGCERGKRVEDDPSLHPHDFEDRDSFITGWDIPHDMLKNRPFAVKELSKVIEAAAKNGVAVEGAAIEGLEIFSEYEKEMALCRQRWERNGRPVRTSALSYAPYDDDMHELYLQSVGE